MEDIRHELHDLGHKVRNIINVHHRITKEPLNLFFVDLEPARNNKNIYDIMALQNKVIQVEPPRVKTRETSHNAQDANNMATRELNCNKPFVCVKCGGPHNSKDCSK